MVLKLLIGLVIILVGAEFFTNGIEWLGKKLNLSQSAVGSILAAVGTALPESMIPIVAIFFGAGDTGHHIGIGAILGAPFMLVTLGIAIIGLGGVVFSKKRATKHLVSVNRFQVERDMSFFLIFFGLAVIAAYLPVAVKYVIAAVLVVGYGYYAWRTIQGECEDMGHCEPLYLARKAPEPGTFLVVLQVIGALIVIVLGANFFVKGVEGIAAWAGISPMLVALVLAPIATELPEKLNSVIWMRQSKDILAIGNMTGAMVFQSSLLPAFGLIFTPWELSGLGLTSVTLAIISGIAVWLINHKYKGEIPGQLFILFATFYIIFGYFVATSIT